MKNRIVIDTNVLISALLLANSLPRDATEKAFQEGVVLSSSDLLSELESVFKPPKV